MTSVTNRFDAAHDVGAQGPTGLLKIRANSGFLDGGAPILAEHEGEKSPVAIF
jgi:hypothetical protein